MEITSLGASSYKLKSKNGMVILNPNGSKLSADIVAFSNRKAEKVKVAGTARRKEPFVITEPGEYEVESISVFGYGASQDDTVYVIHIDDLKVAHLGSLKVELSKPIANKLKGMDVLIVPVIDEGEVSKKMVEMINEIEPTYIVPMGNKAESQKLVELLGKNIREVASLNMNKATLPMDLSEVVVFES